MGTLYGLRMATYEFVTGDISAQAVDAIVNAANVTLLGGGGVDGAIHRRAGKKLLEECHRIRREELPRGLPTGQAVATPGYALPARWVIHAVGPVYGASANPEAELTACYKNCLKVADRLGAKSVAFCAISAGAFGYPLIEAAAVGVRTVLTAATKADLIRFVLFKDPIRDVFQQAYDEARKLGL